MQNVTDHDAYCDGFAYAHLARSRQVSRDGRGMWQASCELCDWRSVTVGPDAVRSVEREASQHTAEKPCEGECLPARCSACNRPIAEHTRHTAADVAETAGATYAQPVTTSAGWVHYAPLSPSVIGQYRGHDPRPLSAAWTPERGWHNVTEPERLRMQAETVARLTRRTVTA